MAALYETQERERFSKVRFGMSVARMDHGTFHVVGSGAMVLFFLGSVFQIMEV